MLIYNKHVPLRLVIQSNLKQNTDQHCLGDLQYTSATNPKLFLFMRNVTSAQGTSATRSSPNAERSAFGRHAHMEELGQKQSCRLETQRPNIYVLLAAQIFARKKENLAKSTSHKIYSDVASAGKKEGFLS